MDHSRGEPNWGSHRTIDRQRLKNKQKLYLQTEANRMNQCRVLQGVGMTYDWSDTGDGLRVDPTGARPPEDVSPCRVQDVVLVLAGVVPCQDTFQILLAVLDCVFPQSCMPSKAPCKPRVSDRPADIMNCHLGAGLSQNDFHKSRRTITTDVVKVQVRVATGIAGVTRVFCNACSAFGLAFYCCSARMPPVGMGG